MPRKVNSKKKLYNKKRLNSRRRQRRPKRKQNNSRKLKKQNSRLILKNKQPQKGGSNNNSCSNVEHFFELKKIVNDFQDNVNYDDDKYKRIPHQDKELPSLFSFFEIDRKEETTQKLPDCCELILPNLDLENKEKKKKIYGISDQTIYYLINPKLCFEEEICSFKLHKNILEIGEQSFSDCKKLTKITYEAIQYELVRIQKSAFSCCTKLDDVSFFKNCINLSSINERAFRGCKLLKEVDLSKCTSLNVIGSSAFQGCKSLKNVVLPYYHKIFTIEANAFKDCESLEKINLNTKNVIKDSAFENCGNLEVFGTLEIGFLNLPSTYEIGSKAFKCCKKIKKIKLGKKTSTKVGHVKYEPIIQNNSFDWSNLDEISIYKYNNVVGHKWSTSFLKGKGRKKTLKFLTNKDLFKYKVTEGGFQIFEKNGEDFNYQDDDCKAVKDTCVKSDEEHINIGNDDVGDVGGDSGGDDDGGDDDVGSDDDSNDD